MTVQQVAPYVVVGGDRLSSRVPMPSRTFIPLAAPALLGCALFAVGWWIIGEPLGLALWAVVCAIVLTPAGFEGQNETFRCSRFVAAFLPIVIACVFLAGPTAALVLTAVAWSLMGGVQILIACRVPTTVAIAVTTLGAGIAFTWPVWSAGLLVTYDVGPWPQRIINLSPAFALNAIIAPTEPLTHRPLAYRLMNLGQDVSYSMPTSAWPCTLVHAGVGLAGMIGRRWTRMDADLSADQNVLSS